MAENSELGIREFAGRIGRSHSWVVKMCQEGKIPKNGSGKIPFKEGIEAVRRIEAEKIIRSTKNAHAGAGLQKVSDDEIQKAVNVHEAMKKAQLATQVATAKLKDLEFKRQSGEYVAIDDVERDAQEVAARLRAFCLAAPTRYSGLLENRSQREAEAVLQDLFSELLQTIHSGRFLKEKEWGFGQKPSNSSASRSPN